MRIKVISIYFLVFLVGFSLQSSGIKNPASKINSPIKISTQQTKNAESKKSDTVSAGLNVASDNRLKKFDEPETEKNESFYWKDRFVGDIEKIPMIEEKPDDSSKDSLYANIAISDKRLFSRKEQAFFSVMGEQGVSERIALNTDPSIKSLHVSVLPRVDKSREIEQNIEFLSCHDIDKNGVVEIIYKASNKDSSNGDVRVVELTDPPNIYKLNAKINFIDVFYNSLTGKSFLVLEAGYAAGVWEPVGARPHILHISNGKAYDVSYKFPSTLELFWQKYSTYGFDDEKSPFERILYFEQIGEINNKIQNLRARIKDVDRNNLIDQFIKNRYLFQSDNTSYHDKWYQRQHPFTNNIFGNYDQNKSLDIGRTWQKMKIKMDQKGYLGRREIYNLLFNLSDDFIFYDFSEKDENLNKTFVEEKRSWKIEKGSYWPERRLGTHKMIKCPTSAEVINPPIRKDNFKESLFNFVTKTFVTSGWWSHMKSKPEERKFLIFPFSENAFFLITQNRSALTAISLDNPANGYKSFQLLEWIPGEMDIQLSYIGDVNLDGITDFTFYFYNFGATENFSTYRTFSFFNGKMHELEFGIPGMGGLEYFFESNGSVSQFGSEEIGFVPMPKNFTGAPLCTTRFGPTHIIELRKDGFVYDVSYKYIGDTEKTEQMLSGKYSITYFKDLVDYDLMGLTKAAQNNYLATMRNGTPDELVHYKIISDCKRLGLPFLVQTSDEVPSYWQCFMPVN